MKLDTEQSDDKLITKPEDENAEWGSFTLHPAGIHTARLDGFKFVKGAEKYGGKQRAELHFTTDAEVDGDDAAEIYVYSALSFDPRAKIAPFLTALGAPIPKSAEERKAFKLANYVGKLVTIVVEHQPRQDGTGEAAVVKSFQPVEAKKKSKPKPNFEEADETA